MRPENWKQIGFGNAYERIMDLSYVRRQCRVMDQKQTVPQVRICIDGVHWVEAATRIVYMHKHGVDSIPDRRHVRRTCLNRQCVAINHLILTTASAVINEEHRRRLRVAARNSDYAKNRRVVPPQAVAAIHRRVAIGKSLASFQEKYGDSVYGIANGFIYRDDDLPVPTRGPIGTRRRPRTKRAAG